MRAIIQGLGGIPNCSASRERGSYVRAIDAIHLLAHPKDDECRERFRRNMTSRYISRRVNVKQTASEIPPLL